MNASLQVVAAYCEQRDLTFEVVSEHALLFRMDLPATELVCTADATEAQFTFQTFYPFAVPPRPICSASMRTTRMPATAKT